MSKTATITNFETSTSGLKCFSTHLNVRIDRLYHNKVGFSFHSQKTYNNCLKI